MKNGVIIDIDGTIASVVDRSPYDYSKVSTDAPKISQIDVVRGLHLLRYSVIFLTGRDETCRANTEEWLNTHVMLSDYELFMRTHKDNRSDVVVKNEIYLQKIKPRYIIKLVMEDRPKMCIHWRSIGLDVLQVGDPYKMF